MRDLAKAARPASELRAEAQSEEASEALDLARSLLETPDLLERVSDAIRAGGYAGDVRPAILAYIALTSRRLAHPMKLAFIAQSAAGKNYAVDAATALMPPTAYVLMRSGSATALIYTDEGFEHKILIVGEADSIPEDGPVASAVRSIVTDSCMEYHVTERDPDTARFVVRRVVKEGPTGLITTSTCSLKAQMETRALEVSISDSPQQTREIILLQSESVNRERPAFDVTPFVALQRWLELAGDCSVTIPFARQLGEAVPADLVRMRRDYPQLLAAIQAMALLYQRQRERDHGGRIIATLDDYSMARDLLLDVFTATATGGVTKTVRETVNALTGLYDGEHPLTVKAVGDAQGLAKSTALYRVRRALELGYLENQETGRGKPAKLVPGDPLPEDRPALPDPSELARRDGGRSDHPKAVRTVEPLADGQSYAESDAVVQATVQRGIEPPVEPPREAVADLESPTGAKAVQRFEASRGDPNTELSCHHRPPGETDALWRLEIWGEHPTLCACCGGPAMDALVSDDGRCPTCCADQPVPERGGHLVRHALDLGGTLVEDAAS